MAMEGVRSSVAALLFLTLVVLAASSASCGDDDAAAAVEKQEKQWYRPLAADEPYALMAFQNKDGEEIRLLADQRSSCELLSGSIAAFANRSGHWFYAGDEAGSKGRRRRRLVPLVHDRSRAEGLWNTLRVLVNTDGDEELAGYMVVGMETSDGDKIRLVVVADRRYFFITGYAKRWFLPPNWSFRDGERHRLVLTSSGGNGSTSHAEVVASNVLAAMMKEGKACCG